MIGTVMTGKGPELRHSWPEYRTLYRLGIFLEERKETTKILRHCSRCMNRESYSEPPENEVGYLTTD
jgi:hypothetical protein